MKNNVYFIGEIQHKIDELRNNPNKRNIGIVNKLTTIKSKKILSDKDISFLESVEIYIG